ncbi:MULTISPECIES: GtrA family protein [Cupriavidus]|nr:MULTISPECIES: GtrA family protein [Cupriavidus]MBB1635736.1 hypothetical protein [Cupriavidus sp. UME77]MCP3023029.1 GtrA family protein [Cupriavidus basilensis]MDR3380775.1 GtrA family protein [Cupriavidus basilensis]
MSLIRQGASYGVIGGVQLGVDWLCFFLLTSFGVGAVKANIAGRVLGALLGFWLNGKKTFSAQIDSELGFRHFFRYIVLWSGTALASTVVIASVDRLQGLQLAWLVKPFADGLLAVAGFVVSRYWIYR